MNYKKILAEAPDSIHNRIEEMAEEAYVKYVFGFTIVAQSAVFGEINVMTNIPTKCQRGDIIVIKLDKTGHGWELVENTTLENEAREYEKQKASNAFVSSNGYKRFLDWKQKLLSQSTRKKSR